MGEGKQQRQVSQGRHRRPEPVRREQRQHDHGQNLHPQQQSENERVEERSGESEGENENADVRDVDSLEQKGKGSERNNNSQPEGQSADESLNSDFSPSGTTMNNQKRSHKSHLPLEHQQKKRHGHQHDHHHQQQVQMQQRKQQQNNEPKPQRKQVAENGRQLQKQGQSSGHAQEQQTVDFRAQSEHSETVDAQLVDGQEGEQEDEGGQQDEQNHVQRYPLDASDGDQVRHRHQNSEQQQPKLKSRPSIKKSKKEDGEQPEEQVPQGRHSGQDAAQDRKLERKESSKQRTSDRRQGRREQSDAHGKDKSTKTQDSSGAEATRVGTGVQKLAPEVLQKRPKSNRQSSKERQSSTVQEEDEPTVAYAEGNAWKSPAEEYPRKHGGGHDKDVKDGATVHPKSVPKDHVKDRLRHPSKDHSSNDSLVESKSQIRTAAAAAENPGTKKPREASGGGRRLVISEATPSVLQEDDSASTSPTQMDKRGSNNDDTSAGGGSKSNSDMLNAYLEKNRENPQELKKGDMDDSSSVASSGRGARDSYTWQTVETGRAGTLQYRMKFRDRIGKTCSPWHNIPLYTRRGHVHVVCATPKRSWGCFEVAQDEAYTPLRMPERNAMPSHYSSNCPWNLTFLPQTWANPDQLNAEYIGLRYDGRPLELIELGRKARRRGQVYGVKVLGAFAVVNHELTHLSWKLLGIAAVDKRAKKLDDVKDVHNQMPRVLEEVREWLRACHCILPGDKERVFGLNERAADKYLASALVTQAYMSWQAFARKEKPQEPAFLPPEPDEVVCDIHSGSSTGGSSTSDGDNMSLATYDDQVTGPDAIPLYDPSARMMLRLKGSATPSIVANHGSDDEGGGSGGDTAPESPSSRAPIAVSCSRRELMRYLRSADPRLQRPAFVQFLSGETDAAQLAAGQGLNKVEELPDEEAAVQFMHSPSEVSSRAEKLPSAVGMGQPSGVRAGGASLLDPVSSGSASLGQWTGQGDSAEHSSFAAAASAAAAAIAAGEAGHDRSKSSRRLKLLLRPLHTSRASGDDLCLGVPTADLSMGCLPSAVSSGGMVSGVPLLRQRSSKERASSVAREVEARQASSLQERELQSLELANGLRVELPSQGAAGVPGEVPKSPIAPALLSQGRRAVLSQLSRKGGGPTLTPVFAPGQTNC